MSGDTADKSEDWTFGAIVDILNPSNDHLGIHVLSISEVKFLNQIRNQEEQYR
jgi:hypothetical protein